MISTFDDQCVHSVVFFFGCCSVIWYCRIDSKAAKASAALLVRTTAPVGGCRTGTHVTMNISICTCLD